MRMSRKRAQKNVHSIPLKFNKRIQEMLNLKLGREIVFYKPEFHWTMGVL